MSKHRCVSLQIAENQVRGTTGSTRRLFFKPELRSGLGGLNGGRVNYKVKFMEETKKLHITPYPFPPYIAGNDVRFTPRQVEAIKSGGNPGLTLIVGKYIITSYIHKTLADMFALFFQIQF